LPVCPPHSPPPYQHTQDGLEAPPEELPAEEGALDEEEDLPIEDLLGSEEDEDLSLAALLRRRMQEEEVGVG
jgi:hypothetical protein